MPEKSPYAAPLRRLLELAGVSVLICLAAQAGIWLEKLPEPRDKWDMQGLFSYLLGLLIFTGYFLFWNAKVLRAIFQEKQPKTKKAFISLFLLFPAMVAGYYFYQEINDQLVKAQGKKAVVPVAYRTVFETPHDIIGARLEEGTLFFYTRKYEVLDPNKKHKTADDALNSLLGERKHLYGSEELYRLQGRTAVKLDPGRGNITLEDFYFKSYYGCLQPFTDGRSWNLFRFNHCKNQKMLTPKLVGYKPNSRGSHLHYQVNNDLFFATEPLHPDPEDEKKLYIARITDTSAWVYALDLSQDQGLLKEFKSRRAHFNFFPTETTLYLIGRNRVLEVKL